MDHLGSEYGLILHDPELRRGLNRGGREPGAALGAAVAVLAIGLLGVAAAVFTFGLPSDATETATQPSTDQPSAVELAQALTAALNAHDVDAFVELFVDDAAGATINADAYAWQKHEIRLWAVQQVQASICVNSYDYRATEHGAAWTADVYRADWANAGVSHLTVANSIWVHDGKLADFTSQPLDLHAVAQLGLQWGPGSPRVRLAAQA